MRNFYKDFYNQNPDFKEYVDKHCKKHKITVDEALEHEIVKQVYIAYKEKAATTAAT